MNVSGCGFAAVSQNPVMRNCHWIGFGLTPLRAHLRLLFFPSPDFNRVVVRLSIEPREIVNLAKVVMEAISAPR